jgi:hypothetical protein
MLGDGIELLPGLERTLLIGPPLRVADTALRRVVVD